MRKYTAIDFIRNNIIQLWAMLLACLLGYWPLTFSVFSVKNDAINYFLPFRFNISSAIRNGEFPFWSPYIYLGYPVSGDMQSGAWNPFVWLLSAFKRYDLTLFHIEYLIYIFLGGIGMYLLSGVVTRNKQCRLFAGIAYMLSGYIFASGQFINWIGSAAFIPLVLYFYHEFLSKGKLSAAINTSISYWLLAVCGYPADSIYLFYLLLCMLIVGLAGSLKKLRTDRQLIKKYIMNHLYMVLVFLGLFAPALISYMELLPYYQRGVGISLTESLENSYQLKNFISLINPWPTWAANFKSETDPTGRNIFLGIGTFLLFVCSFFSGLDRKGKFLFGLFFFSLLFSLGNGFFIRETCYFLLPGMNSFRHPSHFRLFVEIPMILLATGTLGKLSEHSIKLGLLKWTCIGIICICVLLISLNINISPGHFFQFIPSSFKTTELKNWLASLDEKTLSFIGCILQLLFLLVLLFLIIKNEKLSRFVLALNILNLFAFQVLFPANFVSKTSPSRINQLIRNAPYKFDQQQIKRSLLDNADSALTYYDQIGLYNFYNKKIAVTYITNTPSFLAEQMEFVSNPFLFHYISNRSLVFFSDSAVALRDSNLVDPNAFCYTFTQNANPALLSRPCVNLPRSIRNIQVMNNHIKMEVDVNDSCILNLVQNYHSNWKAEVDGKEHTIYPANGAFMAICLPKGSHLVEWNFFPSRTVLGVWVACLTAIFLFFRLIFRNKFFAR